MHRLGAEADEIAAACGLSTGDVALHFQRCVPMQVDDGTLGGTDEQLAQLLTDSMEAYHSSTLTGNSAAVAAALNVRLRVLGEIARRERAAAEAKNLCNCDPRHGVWCETHALWPMQWNDYIVEQTDLMNVKIAEQRAKEEDARVRTAAICASFTKGSSVQ
jgi:hypothetical protein